MSALGFVAKQDSERQSANVARGQGETETDQGPVDLGPGERARHGWRAPDFRAKRDRVAMKAGAASMKITQEVRDYAASQRLSEEEALQKGMEAKAVEFVKQRAEIY
jgi:phosphomethylpyrimidine synthase